MSAYAQNPFIFIFSVSVIAVVVSYLGYVVIDRIGLETQARMSVVVSKQHYAAREAPYVNIAAGRPWVQSQEMPEIHLLILKADALVLSAAVPPEVYEKVQAGDVVHIELQRRRLSGGLLVTKVIR